MTQTLKGELKRNWITLKQIPHKEQGIDLLTQSQQPKEYQRQSICGITNILENAPNVFPSLFSPHRFHFLCKKNASVLLSFSPQVAHWFPLKLSQIFLFLPPIFLPLSRYLDPLLHFELQTISRKAKATSAAPLIFTKPRINRPINHNKNTGIKQKQKIRMNIGDNANRRTCNLLMYKASFQVTSMGSKQVDQ